MFVTVAGGDGDCGDVLADSGRWKCSGCGGAAFFFQILRSARARLRLAVVLGF